MPARRSNERAGTRHGQGQRTRRTHTHRGPIPGNVPWTAAELSRLLAASRSLPDAPHPEVDPTDRQRSCARLYTGIADVPARIWWPALVLVLIDTGRPVSDALGLDVDDYDPSRGTLGCGLLLYELHPLTIEALEILRKFHAGRPEPKNGRETGRDGRPAAAERLLPWTLDGGRRPYYMLYQAYRTLLYRAGLPHTTANLFDRLRVTARRAPEILDAVDPCIRFTPREGQPRLPRTRKSEAKPKRPRPKRPQGVPVERTLRHFYTTVYEPLKLHRCPEKSRRDHLQSIRVFGEFLGAEPLFDDLTEDLLEAFKVWAFDLPRSDWTVRKYLLCLLAQWRYAWRKRRVAELPRDVTLPRPEKCIPDAWSQDELARLLKAAAETPGEVAGIPAGDFWRALILVFYDTALRLSAMLQLQVAHLDRDGGWLNVPAELQKQRAQQVFRLHPETRAALERMTPEGRERLFPWPRTNLSRTLYPAYSDILKRAGLPATSRDKFHKLRRTSATYLADVAGEVEAQNHLGHSSLKLTLDHYIDPTKLTRRINAADVLPRPDRPGGGSDADAA